MSETTFKKLKRPKIKDKNLVLGIDLGTTYSCVGIWIESKVEIIPNKLGYRTTPSMVCFQENETLIGDAAKFKASKYPYLTIFDAKRLIGRKFSEEEVQNDIKTFPFKVTKDEKDNPIIQVEINNKIKKEFTPRDISAIILKQIKQDAESFLEKEIKDVVITVPAFFNDLQREETKNAGIICGFNVLRIIKEPIAAALAYKLNNQNNQNILVFDLGGGTFDISILKSENNALKVISTKGNNHLGGNDFDNRLVDFCVSRFEEEYNVDLKIKDNDDDKEINKKKRSLYRLKIACEKAKIDLSNMGNTTIDIDCLYDQYNFYTNILRNEFEMICKDLFNKCFECVDEVLSDGNMKKNQIDEILLIGGSTKIPKIREMVKNYFNKNPNYSINPDETVACGAAIQGSIILNTKINENNIILLDKIPFPFGIANIDGKMVDIIKEGADIPISKSKIFYTPYDDATSVKIDIYEGPYEDIKDNYKIGEFDLVNLPKKKRGEIEIKVTFTIDINNILHVNANYIEGNISKEIEIVNDRHVYFKDSIKKIDKLFNENKITNYKGEILKFEKEYKSSNNIYDLKNLIKALENFIDTFEKDIKDNKAMIDKYYYYIKTLFRKYNSSFENNKSNRIEIKNQIIKYFNIILKKGLDTKELINIFNQNFKLQYYLLIEYMQFYLNEGINYEKNDNLKTAIQFFNEGLNIFYDDHNNFNQIISKIESDEKKKFKEIYESLFFNLKRNQSKIFYNIGEKYLKNGDEKDDIEEYINAIDNYRKAYSILKEKVSENIYINESFYKSYNKLEDIGITSSQNSLYCTMGFSEEDEEKYNRFDYELEAKIIYKIVFITYEKLQNIINLSGLKERLLLCKDYINKIQNNNNNDLYEKVKKMIIKIEKEIEEINEKDKNIDKLTNKMKENYPQIFKELEEMENKSNEDYIKFILKKYPSNKYKKNNSIDSYKNTRDITIEFIEELFLQYFPDSYPRQTEEEKKYYCIVSKIDAHLSSIKNELETRRAPIKKKKK